MPRTRKKRGGVRSLRKFSKKVEKKLKIIPSKIEEVATKIPKKIMKKVVVRRCKEIMGKSI